MGPIVPVHWAVQLIEFPAEGPPVVRRMSLDQKGTDQLEFALGEGTEQAWLVISPLVRGVTDPVSYQYEITER